MPVISSPVAQDQAGAGSHQITPMPDEQNFLVRLRQDIVKDAS